MTDNNTAIITPENSGSENHSEDGDNTANPLIPYGEHLEVYGEAIVLFDVFRATMHYPLTVHNKVRKMCSDIDFFVSDAFMTGAKDDEEGSPRRTPIHNVWDTMLYLSCYLPSDHPWQDALVQTVKALSERDGHIIPGDDKSGLWSDIPYLAVMIREAYDAEEVNKIRDAYNRPISNPENFNSFVARLSAEGIVSMLNIGIWEIRQGLETDLTTECAMSPARRVFPATEWLIRCARGFHQWLTHTEAVNDDHARRSYRGGPLCPKDITPLSAERWTFWKTRLGELINSRDTFENEDYIFGRLKGALAEMEAVTKTEDTPGRKVIDSGLPDPEIPPGKWYPVPYRNHEGLQLTTPGETKLGLRGPYQEWLMFPLIPGNGSKRWVPEDPTPGVWRSAATEGDSQNFNVSFHSRGTVEHPQGGHAELRLATYHSGRSRKSR